MLIAAGYFAAFCMGIILGLMGGGGSILTVPVLVFLMGLPPELAAAHSLFVVGVASIVGTLRYLRLGKISIRIAAYFSIPSIAAVLLTQFFLVPVIPPVLFHTASFTLTRGMGLMVLFCILLFLAGWTMVRRKNRQSPDSPGHEIKAAKLAFIGAAVGAFTTLVGAGGGFLIVPALLLLARQPAKEAVGTSLFIIAANSSTGFASAAIAGTPFQWKLLLTFTSLAVAGIFAGVGLNRIIPPARLKVWFGWFTILMGVLILFKTLWSGV